MKTKIFVMMTGIPASGKTTARKALSRYLYRTYHVKSQIINKDEIRNAIVTKEPSLGEDKTELIRRARDISHKMLKQWENDEKFPVCIWDNISQDVFAREHILTELQADPDDKILICAIHMNRDLYFCKKNNNNDDRTPIPQEVIHIWSRRYQQPVTQEGFHIIYHVDGTHRFKPEKIHGEGFQFSD